MKKILIAYDGSPGAKLAIQDLARAGLPAQAEARILSIADVWLPSAPPPDEGIFPQRHSIATAYKHAIDALGSAKAAAEEGAKEVQQLFPGWTVSHSAKADSPAWGILTEARKREADLIVIGSHGRTPLERFFLGSVSFKVAAEAVCSVRIVRSRDREEMGPRRLLIGLDGSNNALTAAEEVLQREWPEGTQVDLLTVIDPKLTTEAIQSLTLADATARLEIDSYLQQLLEKTHKRFMHRQLVAQCHMIDGDPKRTLLHQAAEWRSDCIFLGARGTEHGDRLYLGTVASAVCTRAHCSVEIVRAKG